MARVVDIPIESWDKPCSAEQQQRAVDALEQGDVALLPRLGFAVDPSERVLFTPDLLRARKNISWNPATAQVSGGPEDATQAAALAALLRRFASRAEGLLRNLLPDYADGMRPGRASFRPAEIAGRETSWRKDDTRLHVDSFPSSPTQGTRILRLFVNVNPSGQNRKWRIGGSFEAAATRYVREVPPPLPGSALLMERLGLTKSRRTAYDHYMLQLHDRMKSDPAYQSDADQLACEFRPEDVWIVFTDQVPHAAMAGQFALEQTFYVPVGCMRHPESTPLRVLESLLDRRLT